LYWIARSTTGATVGDILTPNPPYGSVTINSNSGIIELSVATDIATPETGESFYLSLHLTESDRNLYINDIAVSNAIAIIDLPPPIPTPPTAIFDVTNSGASAYLINEGTNPTITLYRGATYYFNVSASGYPFWIKTAQVTGTGSAYSFGVTNNGAQANTIIFTVPL